MPRRRRDRISRSLLGLTTVVAVLAGPVFYASGIVEDEDRFVAVADAIVATPDVRHAVAEEVSSLAFTALEAEELVADLLPDEGRSFAVPLTQIASQQLTDAAFTLLDTDVVVDARSAALRETHSQLTADTAQVTLDLRGVAVRTTREIAGSTAAAAVAKLVSGSDTGVYTLAAEGTTNADLFAAVRAIPAVGALVFVVLAALFLAAIAVAPDRRRALEVGGVALAAGGFIASILFSAVLLGILGAVSGQGSISYAVGEAIASDFVAQQRGMILTGLTLALIGLLMGNRPAAVAIRALPGQLWHRDDDSIRANLHAALSDNPPLTRILFWMGGALALWSWPTPTGRVTASIVGLTLFAQLSIWVATASHRRAAKLRHRLEIDQPEWSTRVSASRASLARGNVLASSALLFLVWPGWSQRLVIAFFATTAVVLAVIDVRGAWLLARQSEVDASEPDPQWHRRPRLVAAAAVALAVALGVALTGQADEATAESAACNGHVELCNRPIDDVVWAASHNSMSSTDLGWQLAMQTGDIIAQLDHGVRALLIDTHYWGEAGTVEGADNGAAAQIVEAALADDRPQTGTWLCHGFCALGASDFEAVLADINIWLSSHPREVLMLVVQDEISLDDTTSAFEQSGLFDRVYQHAIDLPWPTLAELIEADERVIVYAENQGSADSWYQNAWATGFTETPFNFALRSDFSCDENRGSADNPFFLMNHWVTTGIPVRDAAAAINNAEVLRDRVIECEAARGRTVNVIAVDFAETGDLIEVVAGLNGLS